MAEEDGFSDEVYAVEGNVETAGGCVCDIGETP